MAVPGPNGPFVIDRAGLDGLIRALRATGRRVIGPRVRDQAIVYDEVDGIADLPEGWTDEQDGGRYRLRRRTDSALFGYAVGPHSWKRELHPPQVTLFQAERDADGGFTVREPADAPPPTAFLAVRACDLAAIAVQDRVLLHGTHPDPHYRRRREAAFIVAVQCRDPGGTCFCASMGTGPGVDGGYDLVLTEIPDPQAHRFVVEIGSDRGADVAARLDRQPATEADLERARGAVDRAADRMGRRLAADGIKALLQDNQEHPRWDSVAERCLSCANCTMVCPTCFCTTVVDTADLSGETARRERRWDSCFTLDFSHLPDGPLRSTTRGRYRQWMTHKLAHWYDQFGTSGCVGCGRCITWCPVGIDITEEVAAIRGAPD